MAEYDLISKTALLRQLDMAIECKDCPRNTNKELYECVHNPTPQRCTCSEIAQICIRITDFEVSTDVQPVNQWISVKDRLPKTGESVLVYIAINKNLKGFGECKPEIRIGWLDGGDKWALQFSSMKYSEVLCWMPLPKPPKDGDTNG